MRDFWQGFWGAIVVAGGWLVGFWYGTRHENWPYEFKLALLRAANHLF